ncbi:acyl-CoA dehydrogenase family protein [Kitasatospora sp. GP82]|uniref:acyl-CoA dehydrogenase family protein n=1 Tax=Kitasatospora sp. GP82 TaxID=3035089 RepID=UPI0024769F05|nr:acyl-CoA dehydrogenase family protein [Kitasatospora sp. GP82]MDH6128534.1 alkylation response protein AidB-like acyl-CoA dehydrogenase [Kitasatospora sp. GP82]
MAPRTRNLASDPDRPSFLEELYQGRFRWDLIHPFPEQRPEDRERGDAAVAAVGAFLRERIDPTEVDVQGSLPDGFLDDLGSHGYLRLQAGSEVGGHGLSSFNTFRVIEEAASWCLPVAVLLGIENALGAGAFLPVLPPGPLADRVRSHVLAGGLSGSADTEPSGAANQGRTTTAVPVEDGAAYLLNGRKIQVVNAPSGGLFSVTASVRAPDGSERNRLFFVDADTPGVRRSGSQELMGMRGLPFGGLDLENVRVPAELALAEPDPEHTSRLTPAVSLLVVRGRLYIIAAPSLATAKLCLSWARDFVARRSVDGRGLGEYEEIQRRLAETQAETFALESTARWSLLGEDHGTAVNLKFEQNASKNICSVLGWRIAERTLSMLGGEGYESAQSKQRRQVPPLAVERAFRDVRGLRITGGVDFLLDNWSAGRTLLSYYYPEPDHAAELAAEQAPPADFGDDHALSARNLEHLSFVREQVHRFGHDCLELTRRHPQRAELASRQRLLILLNRTATELLTMSLTLARAASATTAGQQEVQDLADVYCTTARARLASLLHQRAQEEGPESAGAAVARLGTVVPTAAEPAPALHHVTTADSSGAGR